MYFFTSGRDRGVPVEKPLMMCYNLINAYSRSTKLSFCFGGPREAKLSFCFGGPITLFQCSVPRLRNPRYHRSTEFLKGFVCAHFSLYQTLFLSLSLSLSQLYVLKFRFLYH